MQLTVLPGVLVNRLLQFDVRFIVSLVDQFINVCWRVITPENRSMSIISANGSELARLTRL